MRPAAQIAAIVLAAGLVGCAGGGGGDDNGGGGGGGGQTNCNTPPPATLTLSGNIQPIFNRSCAVAASCHLGPSSALGEDLSTGQVIRSSVNVRSQQQRNLFLIRPGNPDNSYLVRKIEGGPNITGLLMPQGCPGTGINGAQCLSSDDIAAIRTWITECAQDN